jgi:polysaccharide biosynthesis transport protein
LTAESSLAFLRRWAWLLALAAFLAAATSYLVTVRLPKIYEAHTVLELLQGDVTNRTADYTQLQGLMGLARTYAEIVRTQPVLESAISDGNLNLTYADALGLVSVTQVPNTQLLQINARATDPQDAATLASLVASAFMRHVQDTQAQRYADTEQSLTSELNQINSQLSDRMALLDQLRTQPPSAQRDADLARVQLDINQLQQSYQNAARSYSDLRLTRASSQDLFTVVQPAIAQTTPVEPRVFVNVLLAALVGMLLAFGAALIGERLNDRLMSPEAVSRETNLPVLGAVTRLPGGTAKPHLPVLAAASPDVPQSSVAAEAYRLLLANLRFLEINQPFSTLLVTSSDSGEGKTITAANLAIAAAQTGDNVLLVECDLRRPSLHETFNVSNSRGLTTLLVHEDLPAEAVLDETGLPGLRLLTSGPIPPNPSQLLASRRFVSRLAELSASVDLLILDGPPLLAASDSAHLASKVDGVVVIVDAESTRKQRLAKALRILNSVGARVLGTVVNRLPASSATFDAAYASATADIPFDALQPGGVAADGHEPPAHGAHAQHEPTGRSVRPSVRPP